MRKHGLGRVATALMAAGALGIAAAPAAAGGTVAVDPATASTGCGQAWQAVSPAPTPYSLTAAAWAGSRFIAVGAVGTILTSPDGTAWTSSGTSPVDNLTGVAWTGAQAVAVGSVGTILTSPDGAAWTRLAPLTAFGLTAVAWTGEQVAAVGYGGTILTSPDGSGWTPQVSGTPYPLLGIAWTGSQLVAVGQSGTVVTSPDGANWTLRSSGTVANLTGVAWTGTTLVAVGTGGTVLTSPDGVSWTPRSSGTSLQLNSITWTGSQLVAVGAAGTVLTSPDGTAWTPQASGTMFQLSGIAWSGTTLVAVGDSGTVLTSSCPAACVAPSITAQPQGKTIARGQTAALSVTATGTAPLAYHWYQGSAGDTSHPVGSNAASYTTAALTTTTAYWVRVSNSCGHADSVAATVTVTCAVPSITSQPTSRAIASGQSATLSVVASGTAPLAYQWYRGSSGDTSSPVGTNASTFTTPALTAAASYWVRVSNVCGHEDSATATVSIASTEPPTIGGQPQSRALGVGQSAILWVTASGAGPLSYQWYQGASGDTSTPVGTDADTFTTPALTATTSYWVRVSNAYGAVDSATAVVTVASRPRRRLAPSS